MPRHDWGGRVTRVSAGIRPVRGFSPRSQLTHTDVFRPKQSCLVLSLRPALSRGAAVVAWGRGCRGARLPVVGWPCGMTRRTRWVRTNKEGADPMRRWEYVTTPLIVHNTAAILNNWGADGWELVQVVQGPEGGLVAYLKREVEAD